MTEHISPIEQERQHAEPHRQPQELERVEGGTTPDAVMEAALGDGGAKAALAKARGRGVEWVRPTDLIARQSSRLAGRGIDLHAELARRARTMTWIERMSDRARRLPPVSAFGRRGASQSGPARSGVGMR